MGLEPTTLRLKAARSTDWARKALTIPFFSYYSMFFFFFLLSSSITISYVYLFVMTTWPSGLRRVTRNHFSSGGVGSNPAVVVFYFLPWLFFFISSLFLILFFFFSFLLIYLFFPFKKMVTPRFELGSREPESHMLPLHHATFISSLFSLYIFFTILYFFSL